MNSSEKGCQCSEMLSPGARVATPMKPDFDSTVFGLSRVRTSPPRRVSAGISSAVTTCASPIFSTGGSFCQFTATLVSLGRGNHSNLPSPCSCCQRRPSLSGRRQRLPEAGRAASRDLLGLDRGDDHRVHDVGDRTACLLYTS